MPPNWLGVVGSSATTTPLPPAAVRDRLLPDTLAPPAGARAVFRLEMKVDAVPKLVAAPPLTLRVLAEKSMATVFWMTPWALTMAMVVLPVKLAMAEGTSMPMSLPVRVEGAGVGE